MPVYAVHVPNAHTTPDPSRLERFATIDAAKRILLERSRDQRSRTYYLADGTGPGTARPAATFPTANRSGGLLVWIREHDEDAPEPTAPHDEVWSVSPQWTVRRHTADTPIGSRR